MSTPFPDLSVQVTRRRSRCVLDPNLALSREGAMLARLLAPYAEQWVGPEFFDILDNARLYQREPALLVWPGTDQQVIAEMPEVLRDWMQLREEAGRCLYWIGDALRESCLPEDIDERILPRWEAASRSLDLRIPKTVDATGPLIAAMRDSAALCAVLPSSWILGCGANGEPPLLCRHLQGWGLVCEKLSSKDSLVSEQRTAIQQMMIEAGVAPLIWDGLPLAVAHLLIPHAGRLETGPEFDGENEAPLLPGDAEAVLPRNPWDGAKCFWYDVT